MVTQTQFLPGFRQNSRLKKALWYMAEGVGHGLKGIMVSRMSKSRVIFYRCREINMAGFWEEVSMNIDHF